MTLTSTVVLRAICRRLRREPTRQGFARAQALLGYWLAPRPQWLVWHHVAVDHQLEAATLRRLGLLKKAKWRLRDARLARRLGEEARG